MINIKNKLKHIKAKTKDYNYIVEFTINGTDWRQGCTNYPKNWLRCANFSPQELKSIEFHTLTKKDYALNNNHLSDDEFVDMLEKTTFEKL